MCFFNLCFSSRWKISAYKNDAKVYTKNTADNPTIEATNQRVSILYGVDYPLLGISYRFVIGWIRWWFKTLRLFSLWFLARISETLWVIHDQSGTDEPEEKDLSEDAIAAFSIFSRRASNNSWFRRASSDKDSSKYSSFSWEIRLESSSKNCSSLLGSYSELPSASWDY